MGKRWRDRALPLGAAAALAAAAAAAAVALYHGNGGWMYDARVYRHGGAAALLGLDVYRNVPPAFTYTPFAALLFVPLALLPVDGAGLLLCAVSLLCLQASVWLCLDRPRSRAGLAACAALCALAVWLDPVALTLLLGQVNVVLMAAVLADLSLPDRSRWKGLAIGVSAGVKLLPGFFVLYLLLTRRLRAAATAAAAFAATVAAGFALLPGDSARYWGGVFLDSSRVGDPQNVRSQSLRSLLVRWAHTSRGVEPAWITLAALTAAGCLWLAVTAHRRGDELLAACACATATLLVSPITWQHHWTWIVPILVWMGRRAWRARSRALWAAVAVVALEFAARPYQWGVPVDRTADLHLGAAQLLQSSTYAATAVLFLALAALALRRDRLRGQPAAARPP